MGIDTPEDEATCPGPRRHVDSGGCDSKSCVLSVPHRPGWGREAGILLWPVTTVLGIIIKWPLCSECSPSADSNRWEELLHSS